MLRTNLCGNQRVIVEGGGGGGGGGGKRQITNDVIMIIRILPWRSIRACRHGDVS